MKAMAILLIVSALTLAILAAFYGRDVKKAGDDFQAYSTERKNLLEGLEQK